MRWYNIIGSRNLQGEERSEPLHNVSRIATMTFVPVCASQLSEKDSFEDHTQLEEWLRVRDQGISWDPGEPFGDEVSRHILIHP